MADLIPVVSYKCGHRWIEHDAERVRCADCAELYPRSGDLAPMPVCRGYGRLLELEERARKACGMLRRLVSEIDRLLTDARRADGG